MFIQVYVDTSDLARGLAEDAVEFIGLLESLRDHFGTKERLEEYAKEVGLQSSGLDTADRIPGFLRAMADAIEAEENAE